MDQTLVENGIKLDRVISLATSNKYLALLRKIIQDLVIQNVHNSVASAEKSTNLGGFKGHVTILTNQITYISVESLRYSEIFYSTRSKSKAFHVEPSSQGHHHVSQFLGILW